MTFSFPLGLFIGCLFGMLFGRHMVYRSLRIQSRVLPGQWFEIPRAGPFYVEKIRGSEATGKYFGGGRQTSLLMFYGYRPVPVPSP